MCGFVINISDIQSIGLLKRTILWVVSKMAFFVSKGFEVKDAS